MPSFHRVLSSTLFSLYTSLLGLVSLSIASYLLAFLKILPLNWNLGIQVQKIELVSLLAKLLLQNLLVAANLYLLWNFMFGKSFFISKLYHKILPSIIYFLPIMHINYYCCRDHKVFVPITIPDMSKALPRIPLLKNGRFESHHCKKREYGKNGH